MVDKLSTFIRKGKEIILRSVQLIMAGSAIRKSFIYRKV